MKSRISFFDKTVFRKDVTRFAPLWAICLIGGLLLLLTSLADMSAQYVGRDIALTIGPLSVVNMLYAGVCVQLLFGDLFNTRLCNALHAMPLRRETWFITHVVSGLCFAIVPYAIGTVLMFPFLKNAYIVGILWLLGMTLEYLFFFGLAVFCIFLTGNRFAMAAVYAILNFGAMIAYWFVDTIYSPMLYGVNIPVAQFYKFSPVVQMCMETEFVQFSRDAGQWAFAGLSDGWWYLAIYAVLGIGLLVAALLLYRRRKLESAGDFIAVKPVEPVFAVVFTLCIGGVCAAFEQAYDNTYITFLCVGLAVGWFVGQMLLQRTVRVFKGKAFLKLIILALALGVSIFVTWLDPIGITRWVPKAEQVKAVYVDTGSYDGYFSQNALQLWEKDSIQTVIDAHSSAIVSGNSGKSGRIMTIQYTMADGRQIARTYRIRRDTKEWELLAKLYDTPEHILGYSDFEMFVSSSIVSLETGELDTLCLQYAKESGEYPEEDIYTAAEELAKTMKRSLLEAMKKDCEEGLLSQEMREEDAEYKCSIGLSDKANEYDGYRSVMVYDISKNTVEWLKKYNYVINFVPPIV